jgi:hypothetical protein
MSPELLSCAHTGAARQSQAKVVSGISDRRKCLRVNDPSDAEKVSALIIG